MGNLGIFALFMIFFHKPVVDFSMYLYDRKINPIIEDFKGWKANQQ